MFDFMFIFVPIMIAVIFIMVILMIFSPKFRGKLMSNQIKATKYMMDESKEDIKSVTDDMAYATKDGVKTFASAVSSGVKEGLTEEKIFCKYCGSQIDTDSIFCKKCGKEQ